MRISLAAMLFLALSWVLPFGAMADAESLDNDIAIIRTAQHGLTDITTFMAVRPDLFPARTPTRLRTLTPIQRREAKDVWSRFLDYQLMLDALWQRLRANSSSTSEKASRVAYAAFLTRYRHALDFIDRADADPALRMVLNEALPELGLSERSYADFKFRFLNIAMAAEFAAQSAANRLRDRDEAFPLATALADDEARIWNTGKSGGVANTLRNAGQIAVDGSARLIFPVQKGISEWMGDTRVLYGNRYLIAPDQIATLASQLRPGDVLLERREWFLSNIGLPGYWPHAALYVGTARERATFFNDPAVRVWMAAQGLDKGDLESLLKSRHPAAYAASKARDDHGDDFRVIEAMSEGVVFTTLEHSAAADSVAVLRPRLSRLEIAKALLKAFGYHGRPYDFDFDFRTDSTLVCTELVFKAYSPDAGQTGLKMPLRSVAGRPVLTANDIASQFDKTFGQTEQQFDFITFLDGQTSTNRAKIADLAEFRVSWLRPKWHILTQKTPMAWRDNESHKGNP